MNEVTVLDKYPLPRIDDVLDALSHGYYFSVIDLKSGYWQIPMRQSDAEKTAFRTCDSLYQFAIMPFGLKNVQCQRALQEEEEHLLEELPLCLLPL